MEIPPSVFLVIIGVVLILFGIAATPLYQPVGNASFWIGVVLLVIGIIFARA